MTPQPKSVEGVFGVKPHAAVAAACNMHDLQTVVEFNACF